MMPDEKKPYVPPMLRTVDCFCSKSAVPDLSVPHLPVCPVARIGRHQILRPDDFIMLYGEVLSSFLQQIIELVPQRNSRWASTVNQVRTDLDIMLAPICPRCYERDGSLVQTSEPRRLCIPCSRDLEP